MNSLDLLITRKFNQIEKNMSRRFLLLLFSLFISLGVFSDDNRVEGIRGVWVPAPRFTSVLHTNDNVKQFVRQLDELNMNAIFLVAYAETKTIYCSEVLKRYSTYQDVKDGWLLAQYDYKSSTGDPVRDLIDEAHKKGIKVFFWFEYGFMGEGRPIADTNPLLANNPHWIGINNEGQPANYNKHDYYFNSYNPAVQNFLIDLVVEALTLYPDLDGIQGDDRLPAMPRNSGYDSYTVSLYQAQHNGALPPMDYNDKKWVGWRLNILNDFARRLYQSVKSVNPKAFVSFAPNPYPWCEDNLMQDWPQWCKDGVCDLLAVQCYRYSEEAYKNTVSGVLNNIKGNGAKVLFAPGMILMEGSSSKMTPELLIKQININRELGLNGEIYFYNKSLNNPAVQNVLRKVYKDKILFPVLKCK